MSLSYDKKGIICKNLENYLTKGRDLCNCLCPTMSQMTYCDLRLGSFALFRSKYEIKARRSVKILQKLNIFHKATSHASSYVSHSFHDLIIELKA